MEMDDTQEIYMQKLQELLCDEDKIITASFLSSILTIPLQESKNLITSFVNDTKKFNSISKIYILMGILNDGNSLNICLAKEDELDDKRKSFNVITSEQIYSIQKSKDLNIIALSHINAKEIFQEKDKFGLIVGNNCFKVQDKTIANVVPDNVKEEKLITIPKDNATSSATSSKEKKNTSSGIKNLFANMPAKRTIAKNDVKKFEEPVAEKENKNINFNDEEESNNVKTVITIKKETEKESKSMKKTGTKVPSKSNKNVSKKKRSRNDDNDEPVKKRKRIIQQADSDSDDLFGSQEEALEEDVIMSEEEKEPVFKLVKDNTLNKSRVLKHVSKQYYDGEFMVTKRESVIASDSDDDGQCSATDTKVNQKENEAKRVKTSPPKVVQKNNKKNIKKEASSTQPTLMNFFKKK